MRKFPYITVGKILSILKEQGLPITRLTFLKLEKEGLFQSNRSVGGWRVYSQQDADIIIKLIKENYGMT